MSQNFPKRFGRYEIVDKLPSGGMADIYVARDPRIGDRSVVIKVLRDSVDTPEIRERFALEANLLGGMSHVNLVAVFDVGVEEDRPFIAMEYIRGETVSELIARRPALPLSRKLQLMDDLCLGLEWAHRKGVVHRDIKPANLMVNESGVLKILDFGIARVGSSLVTRAGTVMGTLNYMAPEQMMGEAVDARADMFAAGAVFYELLCYRRAFPGQMPAIMRRILDVDCEPLAEVMPDLDPDLVGIINRCLGKTAKDRYRDMAAVRRALGLVRLRVEQDEQHRLQQHIDGAHQAMDREDVEEALRECEQGLAVDADFGPLLELRDDVHALRDRRVRETLEQARAEVDRGALTGAMSLVDAAESLCPASEEAQAVRAAIETARRTRADAQARAVQVTNAVTAASKQLSSGALDEALRTIDAALDLDADHADARALKQRIERAVSDRRHAEDEARARARAQADAQAAADTAREAFRGGQVQDAIRGLEAFTPAHPIVAEALAELRDRAEELRREERAKEQREATAARNAADQARQYFRAGQTTEAISLLERQPDHPMVAAALAELRARALELEAHRRQQASERDEAERAGAESARQAREAAERRKREAAERQQREAAERQQREAAERQQREAAERRARGEAEQRQREAEATRPEDAPVAQHDTVPLKVSQLSGGGPGASQAAPGGDRTLLLDRRTLLPAGPPEVVTPRPTREWWKVAAAVLVVVVVIAVGIVLFKPSAAGDAVTADADADGVADSVDQCPGTAAGVLVDDLGCPTGDDPAGPPGGDDLVGQAAEGGVQPVLDLDGDGVPDEADQCLDTPIGARVNASGCPESESAPVADSDQDGVPDDSDDCADTPAGTRVNRAGCPLPVEAPAPPDADGDGVPDATDRCPGSSGPVDGTGCPRPPASPDHLAVWTSPLDQRRMVWLQAGEFQMGSDPAETPRGQFEQDRRTARIARGFWLDELEVTNAKFREFVLAVAAWRKGAAAGGRHQDYLRHWTGPSTFPGGVANQPVTYVDQAAAEAYCGWAGKRLPSEAEWEYAARAGNRTAYWWGGAMDPALANASSTLVDVGGGQRRNPWGFHDILGNAMEWTQEGWLRGGSFNRQEVSYRVANRIQPPSVTFVNVDYGFRCAR
jgi:hypothetical protein